MIKMTLVSDLFRQYAVVFYFLILQDKHNIRTLSITIKYIAQINYIFSIPVVFMKLLIKYLDNIKLLMNISDILYISCHLHYRLGKSTIFTSASGKILELHYNTDDDNLCSCRKGTCPENRCKCDQGNDVYF